MEIKQPKQAEVVTDVVCDVCNQSTKLQFGNLSAHWGYCSKNDGEKYELQLYEKCFFYAIATLKKSEQMSLCLMKILTLQPQMGLG